MESDQTIVSDKSAVTFSFPGIDSISFLERLKKISFQLFSTVYGQTTEGLSGAASAFSSRAERTKFGKMRNINFFSVKKIIKIVLPLLIGVIVLAAVIKIVRSLPDAQSKPVDTSSQITAPNALATVNLDKNYSFPLKDDKGAVVGNFDYVIQSAAIQKQIIVQGQRATAVNGRDFLILNLKITNNLKKTIQLNTRDYIRLTVASNTGEQLAPDIHNDPVEVQAISTKFTRVGIALDESDTKKPIQLKIGEIDGDKQNIDLNFKY